MTAVIYARYSSDNQREESIEGQIRECTAYAEKNDITVVKHYIDQSRNNEKYQRMLGVAYRPEHTGQYIIRHGDAHIKKYYIKVIIRHLEHIVRSIEQPEYRL